MTKNDLSDYNYNCHNYLSTQIKVVEAHSNKIECYKGKS